MDFQRTTQADMADLGIHCPIRGYRECDGWNKLCLVFRQHPG